MPGLTNFKQRQKLFIQPSHRHHHIPLSWSFSESLTVALENMVGVGGGLGGLDKISPKPSVSKTLAKAPKARESK